MHNDGETVLCLVRDLLFYSKIRAAAGSAGVSVRSLRDPNQFKLAEGIGLIVDLNQAGALEAAAEWSKRSGRPVAGFVSHVDGEIIRAAKAAGIDRVVPRSQFEKILPGLLQSLVSQPG